ncbi:pentachlorophenol monooxygenase [Sinosporangium siamense]|uniref:Pentachlorophenol monooxygenase n=1 Tax=Sinosporangium siamense TaxID=1367973 RepID=A0A919RLH5_9ACTN|nr:pentachlorophenol monooxygenase [Sinosporangium siamense]
MLIVGAGPCGLMTAVELARRGIPVTVVDAAEEAATGSRAVLLWPYSLELFDGLGLRAEADKRGLPVQALCYHTAPGTVLRLPLDAHHAPLVLPQEETVDLLEQELRRLGGTVERGLRVTAVSAGGNTVTATARRADGEEVTFRADWLIGADGSRSTVRQCLGIAFAGAQVPTSFLVAEGPLAGEFEPDAVNYYLGRAGVMLIAPLPGGRARISGALDDPAAPVTPESAQRMLDERGPGGLRFTEVGLAASYASSERIATRFRSGRCFLVGDAAHVHTPTGGQGLNLGFADVRNLVWKLAGVIDGRYDAAILDSYDTERRAAAEQTVAATGKMTRRAVLGPVALLVRNALMSLAHRTGALAKQLVPMLAGWQVRYPDALGLAGPGTPKGLPQPGTRSPAWPLDPDPAGRFQLVGMGPDGGTMSRRGAELAERLPTVLKHRHRVTAGSGFVLLRPDGYVAAAGPEADLGHLTAALKKILTTSHLER